MTAPIETAYAALAEAVTLALSNAGFLRPGQLLELDPPAPFEPTGDEVELTTAAALVKVRTRPVRQMLGNPQRRRYVVERECMVELALFGGSAAEQDALDAATRTALAGLAEAAPTLDGAAERLEVVGQEDDELPPNGRKIIATFLLRIRAGDPLGLTA